MHRTAAVFAHEPAAPAPPPACPLARIGDLLAQVDQGNQVVATDHVDIEEDITAVRIRGRACAGWMDNASLQEHTCWALQRGCCM